MRRIERLTNGAHATGLGLLFALVSAGPAHGASFVAAAITSAQHSAGQRANQPYLGIDVRNVTDDEVTQLHLRDTRGA